METSSLNTGKVEGFMQDTSQVCHEHGSYSAKQYQLLGRQVVSGCPQCLVAFNQRKDAMTHALKMREIKSRYSAADLPSRYIQESFLDLKHTAVQAEAIQHIRAKFNPLVMDGRFTLFLGDIGNGKTHIACEAIKMVLAQGGSASYIVASDMIVNIRSTWSRASMETDRAVRNRYAKVGLLVLDDVGVSSGGDNEIDILFSILDARNRNNLPTILISNLLVVKLRDAIGDRLFDRVQKDGRGFHFVGESLRKKRTEEAASNE